MFSHKLTELPHLALRSLAHPLMDQARAQERLALGGTVLKGVGEAGEAGGVGRPQIESDLLRRQLSIPEQQAAGSGLHRSH